MIILMGVAGAGKSMQGKLFADELGYQWLSTGEIFRALANSGEREELRTGKLVGDDEVIDIVDKALVGLDLSKEVILDGYPRTIKQAEWLLTQVADGRLSLTAIFNLVATRKVVKERLLARGRNDDTDAVIDRRFQEYEQKTLPIINFLRDSDIKVEDIDADQTPKQVHDALLGHIKK